MKHVNWKNVLTALTISAILAFIGGVLEFQGLKADVDTLQNSDKKQDKVLNAVGIIVCTYAIKDEMKDAKSICKEVLSRN